MEAACAHVLGKKPAEVSEERRGQCAEAGTRNRTRLSLEKEQGSMYTLGLWNTLQTDPWGGKSQRHTGSGLQQCPRIVDRTGKRKQMMETIM